MTFGCHEVVNQSFKRKDKNFYTLKVEQLPKSLEDFYLVITGASVT